MASGGRAVISSVPIREVALGWLAPMAKVLVLFIPAACILWWASNQLNWLPTHGPPGTEAIHLAAQAQGTPESSAASILRRTQETWHALFHLVFKGLLGGALGAYLFLRYGLPAALQERVAPSLAPGINPLLRRVFA